MCDMNSVNKENRVKMNIINIGRSLKMLGYNREKGGLDRLYGYYVKLKIF